MTPADVLAALGRSSLAAGVLVGLVLGAQWIFRRRLSPQWRCALWFLVIIRLVPFSFSSAWSLFNAFDGISEISFARGGGEKMSAAQRGLESNARAEARTPSTPLPPSHASTSTETEGAAFPRPPRLSDADGSSFSPFATSPAWDMHRWSWSQVLFATWAAGVLGLAAYITTACMRLSRRIRDGHPVTEPEILDVLRDAAERLRVSRIPTVIETVAVESPALTGFFRPRLLLPAGFSRTFSPSEWRFVFLHELAHLRRRDLILNWIVTALQVTHWFNPLIWYGLARWRLDREMACDAMALEAAGHAQNQNYGRTMLKLVEHATWRPPTPALVGIAEDKRQLRHRLQMILAFTPRRRWSALAISLLVVVGAVGLTDAQEKTMAAGMPAKQPRALTLTILDDATGQPVTGARVEWHEGWDGRPSSVTDASGKAIITIPTTATFGVRLFDVTTNAPGYSTRRIAWISEGGDVFETLPAIYELRLRRGVAVSGSVRDEHGNPIAGAKLQFDGYDYAGFATGSGVVKHQEYPDFDASDNSALSNKEGRWHLENFPTDLQNLTITVIRPDGAATQFATGVHLFMSASLGTIIPLVDIKNGKSMFVLKDGLPVRGVVVDEGGSPVGGATLRFREATSSRSPSVATTGPDGQFEIPHVLSSELVIAAELQGHAAVETTVLSGAQPARIVLPKAKPMRLRLLGDNQAPLAGVTVMAKFDPPGYRLLRYLGKTDENGRCSWETAPTRETMCQIIAAGYPGRAVTLVPDGAEHEVRMRKGVANFQLDIIDGESGKPVTGAELWRIPRDGPGILLGKLRGDGKFSTEIKEMDLPHGFAAVYAVEVRAKGYRSWSTNRMVFVDGDPQKIKLSKATGIVREAPERPRTIRRFTAENDPRLLPLAQQIIDLLASGDIATFTDAVSSSTDDWNSLISKKSETKTGDPGINSKSHIRRSRENTTRGAENLLTVAREAGVSVGSLRFHTKSITADQAGDLRPGGRDSQVQIPLSQLIDIVLTGEPVSLDSTNQRLAGDYTLQISEAHLFGDTWRINGGLRWRGFPPTVANAKLQGELNLAETVAAGGMLRTRPLTASDDPALQRFAELVATLVRTRETTVFIARSTLSREEMITLYKRDRWGSQADAVEHHEKIQRGLSTNLRSMLTQLDRLGANFSHARIEIEHVAGEHPSFGTFGALEALRCHPLRLDLSVRTDAKSPSSQPISGRYSVSFGHVVRLDGRWVLMDEKARWQKFPSGLLSPEEMQKLETENYIVEYGKLPVGMAAPKIGLASLSGSAPANLSDFRGRVVVLEFWATWCGPCQEPMKNLQELAQRHPEWKDRVEFVTISIDDKVDKASEHLARNSWTQTSNLWAGAGGLDSEVSRVFGIQTVPTIYMIDREGKIASAGHPAALNLERLIADQLR